MTRTYEITARNAAGHVCHTLIAAGDGLHARELYQDAHPDHWITCTALRVDAALPLPEVQSQ